MTNSKKFFTLVEMLIVLSIIGILFTIVAIVGFGGMLGKNRDNIRRSDSANIQKAIENYISLYGKIPSPKSQIETATESISYVPVDNSSLSTETTYGSVDSANILLGKIPKEGKVVFDTQAQFNSLTKTNVNTSSLPGKVSISGGVNQWVSFNEDFDNPDVVGTTAFADWNTNTGTITLQKQAPQITNPSLVHYWNFDDNLNDQIGTSHLMFNNYAKYTSLGKYGSAVRLGEMTKEYPDVPLQGLVAHYFFEDQVNKNSGDGVDRGYAKNFIPTNETYRPNIYWQGGLTNLYSLPISGQQIQIRNENECKFGKCIFLNGGGYSFNTTGQSPYNASMTINVWIKGNLTDTFPAGTTTRSVYLIASDDGPNSPLWLELHQDGKISFYRRDVSNNLYEVKTGNVLDGQWKMITATYGYVKTSYSGGVYTYGWRQRIYVNGDLVQEIIPAPGTTEIKKTTSAWNINWNKNGGSYTCANGTTGDCAFKGYMDELSIWTKGAGPYENINPSELYNRSANKKTKTVNNYGTDPNLLLYYRFNDYNPNGTPGEARNSANSGIGTTSRYIGGSTTDGYTPVGGNAYFANAGLESSMPRLEIGTIPASKFDPTKGFSACWWERIDSVNQSNYRVFNLSNGGNTDAISVYKLGTGNKGYRLYTHNAQTGLSSDLKIFGGNNSDANGVQTGEWSHFCVSVDDTGHVMTWKNGAYISSNWLPNKPRKVDRTENHLGYTSLTGNGYLNGRLDDFMLFQGPIDQSTVDRLVVTRDSIMTSVTNEGKEDLGLMNWWDFDYKGKSQANGTIAGEATDIIGNMSGDYRDGANNGGCRGSVGLDCVNPTGNFTPNGGKAWVFFGNHDLSEKGVVESKGLLKWNQQLYKEDGFTICGFIYHNPNTFGSWGNYFEMLPDYKSTCTDGSGSCAYNMWYTTGLMNLGTGTKAMQLYTALGPLASGDDFISLSLPISNDGFTLENSYGHYCISIKPDGSGAFYRNGTNMKTFSAGTIDNLPNISYGLMLAGKRSQTPTPINLSFYMDDLMLFNKGLSDSEVYKLYSHLGAGDLSGQTTRIKNNYSSGISSCAWIRNNSWGERNEFLQITNALENFQFNTQFLMYGDNSTGGPLRQNLRFSVDNKLFSGTHITGTPFFDNVDGEYHHYCATQDSSGNMKLYLDGVQFASGTNTSLTLEDSYGIGFQMLIGNQINSKMMGGEFDIDDLRIYNKALSQVEVTNEFKGSDVYRKNAIINSLNVVNEFGGYINGVRVNSSDLNCTGCSAQISFNGVNVNVGQTVNLANTKNVQYRITYSNPSEKSLIHNGFTYDLRYANWYNENGIISGTVTKPSDAKWTSMAYTADESEKAFITVRAKVGGEWKDITNGDLSQITSDTIEFAIDLVTQDQTQSPILDKIEFKYETYDYATNGRIFTKPILLPSSWVESQAITLNATETKPAGTTIEYFISLDGGSHYKQVTLGTKTSLDYTGLSPILQIVMTTTNNSVSPSVGNIIMEFEGKRRVTSKVDITDDLGIPKEIIDKMPVDPRGDLPYKYAVSGDGKYYQIGIVLENNGKPTAYVVGNYPQSNTSGQECPVAGTPGADLGPIEIISGCTDKAIIENKLYKNW